MRREGNRPDNPQLSSHYLSTRVCTRPCRCSFRSPEKTDCTKCSGTPRRPRHRSTRQHRMVKSPALPSPRPLPCRIRVPRLSPKTEPERPWWTWGRRCCYRRTMTLPKLRWSPIRISCRYRESTRCFLPRSSCRSKTRSPRAPPSEHRPRLRIRGEILLSGRCREGPRGSPSRRWYILPSCRESSPLKGW